MKVTELRVKLYPEDFATSKQFYKDILGFEIAREWDRGQTDKGVMFNTGSGVIELLSKGEKENVKGCSLSLEVENVKALWEKLKDNATVVFALRDNSWGDTSFCIADPGNFELTFFTKTSK